MIKTRGTLLLTRNEVAAALDLDECIPVVEQAFRQYGEGKVAPPGVLGMHVSGGGFHIKAALLHQGRSYFAVKLNGNFCENRSRFGLPNIQGVIVLCDAENGYPLALMDSIEITLLRTGAATAVAARHLARSDSEVATICGCGNQGCVQLAALTRVLPLKKVFAFDLDPLLARQFARNAAAGLSLQAEAIGDLRAGIEASDVVVTCTPSMRFFLERRFVKPGTFIAAIGADNLPVYLIVLLLGPHYRRFAKNPQLHAFVQGVTAAAVGAITGAVVVIARRSVHDLAGACIVLFSLVMLVKWKVPEPVLIVLAGVAGLLLYPG